VLLVSLFVIAGCAGTPVGGPADPGGAATAQADQARAVEKEIAAAKGGSIDLELDPKAVVRVTFPQEALGSDTTVVVTPLTRAPAATEDVVANGFALEAKRSTAGLEVKYPAYVTFALAGQAPDDAVVVRYAGDGTYEPLPTKVSRTASQTVLTAITTHFSNVGVGHAGSKAARQTSASFADYDWVVYINDITKFKNGPMSSSIALQLRAVNTGGDIPGSYTGKAICLTTNTMSGMGGDMKANFQGESKEVQIKITGDDDVAPLTSEPAEPPVAPLIPQTRWSGSGTIAMGEMTAVGEVTMRGYQVSKDLSGATWQVKIDIQGPQAVVKFTVGGRALSFKGYVRGEGKK
jgi:hypothetical protein